MADPIPPDDAQPGDEDGPAPAAARLRPLAAEIGAIFGVVLLLIMAAAGLASVVPLVAQNLYAVVALIFIGVPYWWMTRRGLDFERFGLTWDGAWRGVGWGLVFTAITVPFFIGGYYVWEVEIRGRAFVFDVDNFYQWPVELEGRPEAWGQARGAWIWSQQRDLYLGLRSQGSPLELTVTADAPFEPATSGAARLEPVGGATEGDSGEATGWRVTLPAGAGRTHLLIRPPRDGLPLRAVRVEPAPATATAPLFVGPGKKRVDGALDLERGLTWIMLWVMTQLVFIALPEEFFYRGYIQTRLRDLLGELRNSRGQPAAGRRPLGFSLANLIASLLFALGHLVIPVGGVILATRASVFFPSLIFGWLRERTGTIAAPIVYHACANLMVLLAAPHVL